MLGLPAVAATRIISASQVPSLDFTGLADNKFEQDLDTIVLGRGAAQPTKRDSLRVVHWNIERGFNIDALRSLFTNAQAYLRDYIDLAVYSEDEQGKLIASELAATLHADYAFAPEFVELDPSIIEEAKLDHSQYKGLHGNAIVSRYPIKSAKLLRLPQCYDWYEGERRNLSLLEESRRLAAKATVDEQMITELRRGGRIALIAEISLPDKQTITVVSIHLENRCMPQCRKQQMEFLLNALADTNTALVLAGDMNNFEGDAGPTSVVKLLSSKLIDINFVAKTALTFINPYSLITNTSSVSLGALRKHKDPTVMPVPILLPNKTYSFFKYIKHFEFQDGQYFDHEGGKVYSYNARSAQWSNTNQRAAKGFVETFKLKRSFGIAKFKIDWLFFKPDADAKFRAAFARTFSCLNNSYYGGAEKLSDHNPISVDILYNVIASPRGAASP